MERNKAFSTPAIGPDLWERVIAVCRPLGDAIEKAIDAGPDRRDYDPQVPGSFERARAEHINRVQRLQALQIEFEDLAARISGDIHVLSSYA